MAYNSIAVANRFIGLAEKDGKKLTNMQLQKLVFLANGFSLALLNQPLTYHNIHAWQWGPVLPQLYKRFSKYGSGKIDGSAACDEEVPDSGDENEIITSVWANFGNMTGPQLSALTHEPNSPWDQTWKSEQYGIIEPKLIAKFYKRQLDVEREGQAA